MDSPSRKLEFPRSAVGTAHCEGGGEEGTAVSPRARNEFLSEAQRDTNSRPRDAWTGTKNWAQPQRDPLT